MQIVVSTLLQSQPPSQLMTDPFVQGVVVGVAATALFAFILVVLVQRPKLNAGVRETENAKQSRLGTPDLPPPAATPLASYPPHVDARHLAIIAAAAVAALGAGARVRNVRRVMQAATISAWAESGRIDLQSSHRVRR